MLSTWGDQEPEMSRQKLSSHTISRGALRLETGCFDKPFFFLKEFMILLMASSFPSSSLSHTPSVNSINNTFKISPQSDHPHLLQANHLHTPLRLLDCCSNLLPGLHALTPATLQSTVSFQFWNNKIAEKYSTRNFFPKITWELVANLLHHHQGLKTKMV